MDASDDADPLTNPEDQYYIEEVQPEEQEGWTTRPDVASDEARPYLAPTDPPLLPSGDEGVTIATGFGSSPEDAPFRGHAPTGDAWIEQEVERVLREDALTSKLLLEVRVREGTVYLHGVVGDLTDAEMAENVASQVPGVVSVEDRTEVNPDALARISRTFVPPDELT